MTKPYFTLISRESKADAWAIEFGDYSRAVVEDELADMAEHKFSRSNLKIIRTETDTQFAIEAAVRNANGLCIGCDNPPLDGYRVCQSCGEEGIR